LVRGLQASPAPHASRAYVAEGLPDVTPLARTGLAANTPGRLGHCGRPAMRRAESFCVLLAKGCA